jgi:hypothetical protein
MYVNNANSKYLCLHMLILALFDDGRGNPVQLFIFSVMTQHIWSSEQSHRFRRFINTSGSWTHLGVWTSGVRSRGFFAISIFSSAYPNFEVLFRAFLKKIVRCFEMKHGGTSGSFDFPRVGPIGEILTWGLFGYGDLPGGFGDFV